MSVLRLPGVFAPHPETGLLAGVLAEHGADGERALDLCTGTGVLALALARAGAREVTAIDVSNRAVVNARINARRAGVRVRALRGDLFAPVRGERFELIVSNPPYVPAPSAELPRTGTARAWDAGLDGRLLLDRICDQAAAHLAPGGRLLLTHSSLSGVAATCSALTAAGLPAEVIARRHEQLGPIMHARAELFEDRGLLAPGVRTEELVVILARAPRTAARQSVPAGAAAPLAA